MNLIAKYSIAQNYFIVLMSSSDEINKYKFIDLFVRDSC